MKEDSDVLIKVDNISKRFCRDLKSSLIYGVQDIASDLAGIDRSSKPLRKKEFYANEGISFELKRGECLGLIGHNGAGKTTLLKMLNGLIKPDQGTIEIRGRVGALIALGAGFNPILTGKENVYIAGSVLGLTKNEINEKYDEIVEFSELHDFMGAPVQSYSSGMQVRLGFAVATAMNPDILLIDEVLAVGDANFRNKCLVRIKNRLSEMAVIFVSHDSNQVGTICDKSLWLEKGTVVKIGKTKHILPEYVANYSKSNASSTKAFIHKKNGSEFSLLIKSKELVRGEDLSFSIKYALKSEIKLSYIALRLRDSYGSVVLRSDYYAEQNLNSGILNYTLERIYLKSGTYKLDIELNSAEEIIYRNDSSEEFVVNWSPSDSSTQFGAHPYYQPKLSCDV